MYKFYLISSNIISVVGSILSIAAGVYSWQVYRKLKREQQRLNKKVRVTVACGPKNFSLPGEILGAEFSRQELLGCLGMLPRNNENKGQRFSIDYLCTPGFHQHINEISKSNEDRHLIIPCTEEEFNQFDLELIRESQKIS